MINFDDYANENKTKHNKNWPYIPDHLYRILMIGGSGSGKTNALLNLINNQPGNDKKYLYAKDPCEAKYQFPINKRKSTGLKQFNDPKAFIEYSNDMQDIYKTINEYHVDKERKILIVFDDIIADMINNIRFQKMLRLNTTHFFLNKRELQQIALNHSSDISSKDFIQVYRKYTTEPYPFLVNNTMLASDNPLRFRKNLLNI